jgi:hypothetical protein
VYGPVQNLTAQQRQTLGVRLAAAFGRAVNVAEVQQVGEGANNATHFVAIENDGTRIGLKASNRVADGSGKERLLAEVADILTLPNSCRAVQVAVDEIAALQGLAATAILWLANSVKLSVLQPPQIAVIKANPADYLFQYGQWMAVGLLLGVRDRHTGNWVWSPGDGRLAMIDNEDCLQPGVIQDFYPGIDLVGERSVLKAAGPAAEPARSLAAGLELTQDRFHARRQNFDQVLAGFGFSAGYNSHFMTLTSAQLVSEVFANLA